jgi:polyisoprenoid-binding protein YceI
MEIKWKIDTAHSEIAFKVKHMMISTVTGHFDQFQANVTTEEDDFKNAIIDFTAKTDSINTKNNDRDTHLKSEDFFAATTYPEIRFKSKSFNGNKLVGDLTIKDVTKEISLNVDFNGIAVDPYDQTKAGFEISGELSRKDYNLTWNAITEAGSIVVSDKVKIVMDVQMIKEV